jgi:DNA-binding MarR family transcriptional regulator/N-acetylglutamate synthase-like GNAT family acetyltransferase
MQEHLIDSVRRFNRFYTRRIGALNTGFLDSPFSLAEVRVLYELAHRERCTATDLARHLDMDAGYLSRLLAGLQRMRLVRRRTSRADARRAELSLTAKGRRDFARIEGRQRHEVRNMLAHVGSAERRQVLEAMQSLERVLAREPAPAAAIVLRDLRPGDIGWITHRQGILYHEEYGWDSSYEALVAEIMARFVRDFDPGYERAWVAERNGEIVGSVFCVRRSKTVAQLRLLYVEPSTRGSGLGTRLVDECIGFARARGYRKMMLWTNSILHAARRIYQRAGFRLVESTRHRLFGRMLTSQSWERGL